MPERPGELQEPLGWPPLPPPGEGCKGYVQQARDAVWRGVARGFPPGELLRQLAVAFEQLLVALHAQGEVPAGAELALVALGGYGRGELFPYSDIDLLILWEHGEDETAMRLVERMVYPLWDAGVSVGHAVRSIEGALELAAEDLTMRTALLDARWLAGAREPFAALVAGGLQRFFSPERVSTFVEALREERAGRHQRFGETEYLLEPNIKHSKGGLRDLNTALWAAKARFGAVRLDDLAGAGAATLRQVKTLKEAQEFLQRLRLAMQRQAGRAQDHLLFELQETLAPQLYPETELPGLKHRDRAVEPAVERLMHAFYRHARTVVLESERILERCCPPLTGSAASGQPVSEGPAEHLVVVGQRVRSDDPQRFWEQPWEMLRAFRVSLERGLPLERGTQDAIAEAVAELPGAQLVADGRAAELWLEILCHRERPAAGTLIEEMHHLGLVSAMIPEFEACTGRVQHDLYHVYTVDLHSLKVVALLKAWGRGELADDYPMPVAVMERVEGRQSLMLAALLHDVAKPLGRGHAERGARLAVGVAARLGLSPQEQAMVHFLVQRHLLMAHISQRRDLADLDVVTSFAEVVGSVDGLRQLYLLTAADAAMTAPGNLSEWKASLLEELFLKTYRYLEHGGHQLALEQEQNLVAQRDALELAVRRTLGPAAAGLVPRVPNEMILTYPVAELVYYLATALDFERAPGAVLRIARRARGGTTVELTVCCADSPGRLALITGVMLIQRIEVLAAQVCTLEHRQPARAGCVLDIFTVEAREPSDPALWSAFAADLERALRGELAVADEVRRRTQPSALAPKVVPRVSTEVVLDNAASERHTVLEVQAADRLGVLYAITQALSNQSLEIHLSKVASEAGRVIDIFYVSEGESGGKVLSEERQAQVRRAIASAIEELGRRAEVP